MGGQEVRFIEEAFQSNYIAPLGPMVDAFEKEFAEQVGMSHTVAVSSGTAAMHIALRLLGISARDQVLASTLTFIGSVSPVTFLGAEVVFIDSERSTWNMDPDLLEQQLEVCSKHGQLPRAVIPTDLYGQCADYGRILTICERYGVPVVADAAEALGATYQRTDGRGQKTEDYGRHKTEGRDLTSEKWVHAGVGAKAAIFSFNGNKIITTSGGGMLASEDKDFIERARFLSQQARDPFPHYEHTEIGYNYRMSNILAAIGRGQLLVLEERVGRKREIFNLYQETLGDLPGIEFMPEASYGRSNRWLTVILITPEEFGCDRETVRLALEAENIESRPIWKPMHLQPVFNPQITQISQIRAASGKKRYPCRVVGGQVAEDLFRRGLCLPSGTAMSDSDVERVAGIIKKVRVQGVKGSVGVRIASP
jgi:dTDP-4-amino-4,6-dideoxygalactose transaminase